MRSSIARFDFMSSMNEAVISEVVKRPLLWDHRYKDYRNRDFVDNDLRRRTARITGRTYYKRWGNLEYEFESTF